jgi:hypothetical protein
MQFKAWFDKVTMLVAMAPVGIIPILFLDSFKLHLLGSVANPIQGLGVEFEIIPPGCTGLVQPIDAGINKPFKANMRKIYMEWLLGQDADTAIPSTSLYRVGSWRQLDLVLSIR